MSISKTAMVVLLLISFGGCARHATCIEELGGVCGFGTDQDGPIWCYVHTVWECPPEDEAQPSVCDRAARMCFASEDQCRDGLGRFAGRGGPGSLQCASVDTDELESLPIRLPQNED